MVDFAVNNDLFTLEEKILLNKAAVGSTKDDFLLHCEFARTVTESDECISLLCAISEKVTALSDEEWEDLQTFLPFAVSISDDDFDFDTYGFSDVVNE